MPGRTSCCTALKSAVLLLSGGYEARRKARPVCSHTVWGVFTTTFTPCDLDFQQQTPYSTIHSTAIYSSTMPESPCAGASATTPFTPGEEVCVGWAGMGAMGSNMAANLHKQLHGQGRKLHVHNRDGSKCGPLVAAGAVQCISLEQLATSAHIVFTMLAHDEAVISVVQGLLKEPGRLKVRRW